MLFLYRPLNYHSKMERQMDPIKGILSLVKTAYSLIREILYFFLSHNETDVTDRPQSEGSDLFGEHNFRTGNMDSGADPDGWYEEDL